MSVCVSVCECECVCVCVCVCTPHTYSLTLLTPTSTLPHTLSHSLFLLHTPHFPPSPHPLPQVSRVSTNTYVVVMNNSTIEVDAHKMGDGGMLLSFGGATHTVYMKENVDHFRFTISGKTIEFEKENDPRILRSSSPGKLLHFLIDEGGHVNAGQPFAEIEV